MSKSDNELIAIGLWSNMLNAAIGSQEKNGMPHVSFVAVVPRRDGSALLLLSELARHTINIKNDNRVSLLVVEKLGENEHIKPESDPLAGERITLHGEIRILSDDQIKEAQTEYLCNYPSASQYIHFQDFKLYVFYPSKIFLVGGFGRIETLAADILRK